MSLLPFFNLILITRTGSINFVSLSLFLTLSSALSCRCDIIIPSLSHDWLPHSTAQAVATTAVNQLEVVWLWQSRFATFLWLKAFSISWNMHLGLLGPLILTWSSEVVQVTQQNLTNRWLLSGHQIWSRTGASSIRTLKSRDGVRTFLPYHSTNLGSHLLREDAQISR
jgi:hypothetical protein